jgi:thymidylate kinase
MINLKKNIIISFMGVDGSGKTTIAKSLQKMIKKSQYLHLKPYILFLDRRIVVKKPQLQNKSFFLVSFLRLLSWLISYKIFFFQNKIKKIYLFDRYAHDILIDPLRYKSSLSQKLTKTILNLFPKPDLWIFLNPPLKTIKSRKKELSDNELRRQISEYTLFFRNKKNILMLNTNMKKKNLIILISKKIKALIQ